MTKILIIEDSEGIRTELAILLSHNGYDVEAPEQFDNIVSLAVSNATDLVLLDLNLPDVDGLYVIRELRKCSLVPVIIVTSRVNEIDELLGMNFGADDFITKPYSPQILLARIASVLRRSGTANDAETVDCGRFSLDLARSSIRTLENEIELTRNELRITETLCRSRGLIVSRKQLMQALWENDIFVDDNTLTVNVTRLRAKLNGLGLEKIIETRRGQGYLMNG